MKRTPLRRVSKTRAQENVQYTLAIAQWKQKREGMDGYHRCQFRPGPPCDLAEDRCMDMAMHPPHHRAGRAGALLYDQRRFLALCFKHHQYVENNKRWSRENGYITYR